MPREVEETRRRSVIEGGGRAAVQGAEEPVEGGASRTGAVEPRGRPTPCRTRTGAIHSRAAGSARAGAGPLARAASDGERQEKSERRRERGAPGVGGSPAPAAAGRVLLPLRAASPWSGAGPVPRHGHCDGTGGAGSPAQAKPCGGPARSSKTGQTFLERDHTVTQYRKDLAAESTAASGRR